MTRILVLYYSSYGHIETDGPCPGGRRPQGRRRGRRRQARARARAPRGRAASPPSASTSPRRSPTANELADYDAIIFGTPTRFGNMASQMRNFLDQTGGLWMKNALVGKFG